MRYNNKHIRKRSDNKPIPERIFWNTYINMPDNDKRKYVFLINEKFGSLSLKALSDFFGENPTDVGLMMKTLGFNFDCTHREEIKYFYMYYTL